MCTFVLPELPPPGLLFTSKRVPVEASVAHIRCSRHCSYGVSRSCSALCQGSSEHYQVTAQGTRFQRRQVVSIRLSTLKSQVVSVSMAL